MPPFKAFSAKRNRPPQNFWLRGILDSDPKNFRIRDGKIRAGKIRAAHLIFMPPCASIDNRQIGRNQHTTASDTLAGRAASLTGEIAGKKLSRYLEIEPTLGDTDDKIDLRLFIEDKTHSDEAFALNTAITLQNEFPLEFSAAGRKTKKVTVSVQRLEIAH